MIGSALGSLGALIVHLLWRDSRFVPALRAKWAKLPIGSNFDGFAAYTLQFETLAFILIAALAVWAIGAMRRYMRAWWAGVASLTTIATLIIATTLLTDFNSQRFLIALTCLVAIIASEVWRFETGTSEKKSEGLPPLNIPIQTHDSSSEKRWTASSSDEPIQEWHQDIIGRTSVVELLAEHIFVQKTPIVALQGGLGDGKTSVLNLLRIAIENSAVVVSFSAWVPGSHETLAIDLFRDIATECKKVLYVPQLRKQSIAYARTISGSVSYLGGIKELFPAQSQRQEIEEIRQTLGRVPLPIVVSLDEIDRMQQDELLVLLKILRGASSIPNVTFVCAFSGEVVKNRLPPDQSSSDYLEKFFPVSVNLTPPPPDMVGRLFEHRIKAEVNQRKWFIGNDEKKFTELLQYMWQESLFQICSNLRKASLLLNSVVTAARPIAGEVNTIDLIGIEAIRRVALDVHSLIRKNGRFLTYGNDIWLKSRFATGRDQKDLDDFFKHLDDTITTSPEPSAIRAIMELLFPKYAEQQKLQSRHSYQRPTNEEVAEREKRICDSDYFSMYLRSAVPEEMYSESELGRVIARLNDAKSSDECDSIFAGTLSGIPPHHPKRADFLWKLGRSVDKRLNDPAVVGVAYAAATHARDYTYDMINIGEAARALNIVFEAVQKFSKSSKAQEILVEAMRRVTDDTFAIRLLDFTKNKERNKILTNFALIDPDGLADAFMQRMRVRYGKEVDASHVLVAQVDWYAFRLWAQNSEDDKLVEQEFWRRFIGESRKRLAQAINILYPKGTTWSEDPRPIINVLFPISELKMLTEALPTEELDNVESEGIKRLEELLKGSWTDITRRIFEEEEAES